ncbi:MAG: preprotein translocase subunit SecA [Rhizobacter sp.]|nr:preprotein translocase subunit SecA [Bacteriovorax sp.]
MFNPLHMIFGTKYDRDLKKLKPLVEVINALEPKMKQLSDEELKAQTPKLRAQLASGKTVADILPEAFATIREASTRVLGMRHFDVQMMGGLALYNGGIAEMKTGEGKTLTGTLPLYAVALEGKGAHVVTVNDYLAKRDADEMGVLYEWMGLTIGCILSQMTDEDRQVAYKCDITYGTNNEFAFDYLRDNMKFSLEEYVQRDHHFCIVDEVDSILIDEARTPLLISGPSEGDASLYYVANDIIPQLKKDVHYTVDEKARSAMFTEDGVVKVQELLKIDNLYKVEHSNLLHHLNQSLKAHSLFKLDVDYVNRDGQIIIVDEFTGRLKEGSRWSDGLHQSVEAKEGVKIKSENQTLASITFQNYFKLYKKLSGMTGTADTEAEEFMTIYKLDVVVIPTNLPMARKDEPDIIYKNRAAKYKAVAELIKTLHAKGQPVLVGTIAIETSELLSQELTRAGIKHEVLNAKQHEREAEIIKNAGQNGAVTIATNMAGRGTDIKLTPETKAAGGLYILGTERHESRRIDNQLRGRSGRQGDPGNSKFFLSLEDDLMRIFGSDKIAGLMNTLGMKEDEPIEHKMISNAIAKAQQKVEAHNFDIRKHLLEYDNVMNEQRRIIYKIRRDILNDSDNAGFVSEMVEDVAVDFLANYRPEKKAPLDSWDWAGLKHGFKTMFNTDYDVSYNELITSYDSEIEQYFGAIANKVLEKKFSQYEPEQIVYALREILLSAFDQHWKDHLLQMDHAKEGINLRAYAQKDPLTEYKKESFLLFDAMKGEVKKSIVNNLFTVRLYTKAEIEELQKKHSEELEAQLEAHRRLLEAETVKEEAKLIKRSNPKVGRNDPCPCGSGKKYKQCHGTDA